VTLIAPSILSADFSRLGEEVRAVDSGGADWLHLDVMDGHFVPNLTIGPVVVAAVRSVTTLTLDAHLMIENPERFIPAFAEAGTNFISVHEEICHDLPAIIAQIRQLGVRPAVAINPATELGRVAGILPDIDMLLIMSVNPGFGAQPFIDSVLDKIMDASRLKRQRGLRFLIEVDGGIKVHNAARVAAAGAEVLVSGSGVFGTSDYGATIATMRAAAQDGYAAWSSTVPPTAAAPTAAPELAKRT
jgi:ribulose-phosphate 3-epimerase